MDFWVVVMTLGLILVLGILGNLADAFLDPNGKWRR
jgi:hypothetical protein